MIAFDAALVALFLLVAGGDRMAHMNWTSLGIAPLPRSTNNLWRNADPDDVDDPVLVTISELNSTNYAAWCFCVPESRIIDAVGFRTTDIGTPTAQYRVSLQAMIISPDASDPYGIPSGTPLAGIGGPAKHDFYPSGVNFKWYVLEHPYQATRGDMIAIVVQRIGGTLDPGQPGLTVSVRFGDFRASGDPYARKPEFNAAEYPGAYGIRYSDSGGTSMYGNPIIGAFPKYVYHTPPIPPETVLFQTGAIGERVALRFALPAILGSKFKVAGLRFQSSAIGPWTATGKVLMGLWNQAGTLLDSYEVRLGTSFQTPFVGVPFDNRWAYRELYFTGLGPPPELDFATTYYAGLQQVDSNKARLDVIEVRARNEATYPFDDMDAYPGGKAIHTAKWRQIGGVWQWEPYANLRPLIDLILTEINT